MTRSKLARAHAGPQPGEWRNEHERVCARACLCASVSSESGRMASGVWPCGLWTLAAWRGLNLHARLGLRTLQGRMVCNLPGACPTPVPDPHWCPVCPHPAGLRLPFWRAFTGLSFQW